jgi:6-phosphogluconate dehydrogenase
MSDQNTNEPRFHFGVMGLGTMGRAVLLNIADNGNPVAGYNRTPTTAQKVAEEGGPNVATFSDIAEFVRNIARPRAILLMLSAGGPTDQVLDTLVEHLEPGDFVIDGGNSLYKDTERRLKEMEERGLGFMGMGVSGGEKGARFGPSMMPGGTLEQYERVRPIFESIAAKYNGEPCVALMGARSAGHYVKTVHNGIEYGIMQLIAETYDLMHRSLGLSTQEIGETFARWNEGALQSFLVEITGIVLQYKEEGSDVSLVDLISDKAKAKGTGKWTSQDAMDLGLPVPTIDAAVTAREISGYKAERQEAEKLYVAPTTAVGLGPDFVNDLEQALHAASIISYAQGLALIKVASDEYHYGVNLETVAKVWRAGCIIRSRELESIRAAFERRPDLPNLLLDAEIAKRVQDLIPALRRVVAAAVQAGIPAPAYASALAYFDGYRTGRLPANVIQAQRDLFGAHTYERLDAEGTFHTQWERD